VFVFWPSLLLIAAGLLLYIPTVMVDAALALVGRGEISRLAEVGNRAARYVQRALANKRRWVVNAIMIRVAGMLLVGMGIARLLGASQKPLLWIWIVVPVALWFLIVLAQLAVRLWVQATPTEWAVRLAPWMMMTTTLLWPVAWLLRGAGAHLRVGFSEEEDSILLSDDGARLFLPSDGDESDIEESEKEMIASILEMNETVVREVMVPRTEMVWIESGKHLRQALSLALRSGFSRIAVIGEDIDDVVGVVYLKDVVARVFADREAEQQTVASVMREAYLVPDSKQADDLLREMRAARVHLAIVIDEYGGTAGLVTIEDVLEEIVGEIADEYDTGAPEIERVADDQYRLSARAHVEDVAEALGITADGQEGVDTIAGLLAVRLGRVPIPGSDIRIDGWEFRAEAGAGRRNRVATVLATRVRTSDLSPGSADDDLPRGDAVEGS